jgi:hypothetical protein
VIITAIPSEPPAPPLPPARPWECEACHHVIGHIERRRGIDWLIYHGQGCIEVLGTANLPCQACGHLQSWHMSGELLVALMAQRGRLKRLCEAT